MKTSNGVVNKTLPITQVFDHPRNYKFHELEQMLVLEAGLDRFEGQVRSVVVQATGVEGVYYMIAGHGIKKALIEWGETYIRCDVIPASWSDEKAIGYMIHDNKSAELSRDDTSALLKLANEQIEAGHKPQSFGMSENDVSALLGRVNTQLEQDAATRAAQESAPPPAPFDGVDTTNQPGKPSVLDVPANPALDPYKAQAGDAKEPKKEKKAKEPKEPDIDPQTVFDAPRRAEDGDVWRLGQHWLIVGFPMSLETALDALMVQGRAKAAIFGNVSPYDHESFSNLKKLLPDCENFMMFDPGLMVERSDDYLKTMLKFRNIYRVLVDAVSIQGDTLLILGGGPGCGLPVFGNFGRILRMHTQSKFEADQAIRWYELTKGITGARCIRNLNGRSIVDRWGLDFDFGAGNK